MKLSNAQQTILNRVKRYPKGIKVTKAEERTALILDARGLIDYDPRTGVARMKRGSE